MDKIVDFLKEARTFFLATADAGGHPRVRPFGAFAVKDKHFYFATNDYKNVYHQLRHNPRFEICADLPAKAQWLRINGDVVFPEPTEELKTFFLEANPGLQELYPSEEARKSIVIFRLDKAGAHIYSYSSDKPVHSYCIG
ncbi:MAG: pyridoxamine 5'-phosphate oxidase family protein [Tannerellaceae bacterium]|nr:pyridoxamine 5'-phosphate oxidase family protein [Tannerellaceae bacterium]